MNKFIYIVVFLLLCLALVFTYKVRHFRLIKMNTFLSTEANTDILKIKSMPIIFDAQRKLLTALYREKHTGDCNHILEGFDFCVAINPKIIVIHMTGLDSLKESYEYMKEPVLREERTDLMNRSFDRLNVSAHYLIDKDGSIYSLMPDNYMARHAMGVNHISIGIENVGLEHNKYSTEQVKANVKLISFLKNKYPIEKIISHSELDLLAYDKNNPYYIEKIDKYYRHKDCGAELAIAIKKELGL